MDINKIRAKFSSVALIAIEAEVRTMVENTFSSADLAENAHLIESFYVQPVFHSTLLRYLTMQEQYSTLSLMKIMSDVDIQDTEKDAIVESFASDLGIDLTGQDLDTKMLIVNSAITSPDRNIKKVQSSVSSYSKAAFVVSGASREMFRNSPEHVLFGSSRFSIPFLYEGFSSKFKTSSIMNQPVSIADATRYENIRQSGRSSGLADVYLNPEIKFVQKNFSTLSGEVTVINIPAKKYAYIKIISITGEENISYEFSSDLNIGFGEREIILTCDGAVSASLELYYFDDTKATEDTITAQVQLVDISFTGMVPILVDLIVENEAGLSAFKDAISIVSTTKEWMNNLSAESSKLSQVGNATSGISGEIFINPVMSKDISFYGSTLAISKNSILSWVSESNSCIIPRQITVLETGDVITI